MNCFNHPEEVAVASCIDCGKGLCKECTSLYQMPICNECNMKRVKNDKSDIFRIYLPSIICFVAGIIIMVLSIGIKGIFPGIIFGWLLAGIPWGWKVVTFIQPRMFLFLSIFGWVIYFFIKFLLAYFVGIVALPIGIVKLIISIVSANKKEENINQNMQNN